MNEKQTRSSVGEIVAREEKNAHGRGAKSTVETNGSSTKKAVAEKAGGTMNNRDRGRRIPVMTTLEAAKFHAAVAACGKDECWPWKLYIRYNGYGQFMLNRKPFLAHRVAYFLAFGDFDASKSVCHRCDNREIGRAHV